MAFATDDHVDFGSSFLQEACEVGRGGTCTDNSDGATAEFADLCMLRAVGDELLRQIGEDGRDIAKVGDADGDNDTVRGDKLTSLSCQGEAFRGATQRGDVGLFEAGDEALLKLHSIGDEGFEWRRDRRRRSKANPAPGRNERT